VLSEVSRMPRRAAPGEIGGGGTGQDARLQQFAGDETGRLRLAEAHRGVLSNRRMPMRASSRATARLTPDDVSPSASPALAKLPLSTIASNTPMPASNLASKVKMIVSQRHASKYALTAMRRRAQICPITLMRRPS
jgi:hypothetical protein